MTETPVRAVGTSLMGHAYRTNRDGTADCPCGRWSAPAVSPDNEFSFLAHMDDDPEARRAFAATFRSSAKLQKRYVVTLCVNCRHPGGRHIGGNCNLCGCTAWADGPTGYWSDALTLLARAEGTHHE